jgi:TatD DNase family protein
LAKGLPVLIHCRRAFGRLMQILDNEGGARIGGILHAYSGSLEMAREAIRRNFAISFAGSLTYPGARRAPQLLAALPPEWIVVETDAPDLTPLPRRREENRPAYLPLVGAAVAEVRGWSLPETAHITTANAHRVLRIAVANGKE